MRATGIYLGLLAVAATGMIRAIQETWQVARSEVAARWGGFCLLTLLFLAGYAGLIFSMTVLNIGGLPNYLKTFRVLEGIVETLTLSMPLRERYEDLSEQPILMFAYLHPLMNSLEGAYTLTLHALLNLILMSALIALYCLLLGRALRRRGLTRGTVAGLGLGGGGSAVGVLTSSVASVACCGGAAASVLLTLLGVGAGTGIGLFLAEYDRAFGVLGVLLMLVSLWIAARWIISSPCAAGGGPIQGGHAGVNQRKGV